VKKLDEIKTSEVIQPVKQEEVTENLVIEVQDPA
jgi:hypothetical protein